MELRLVFSLWLVHPFFSGYQRVYVFWITSRLETIRGSIEHFLQVMREENWRWVTYVVQYIMRLFNQCINQVNDIVRLVDSFECRFPDVLLVAI